MSETRKLYYEDVYKKEFTAKVLECGECEKGFAVILDQTAFYPEGGGQPCDLGTLNGIAVLDVQEKDGEIVHYTKEAVEAGSEVIGKIDWNRRFDLMQQHSGEHIVSGLVHEAYGYDNVGFHMSSDVITVDLSGVLTEAQLAEIEAETNQKIWENSEVEITYPSKEELEKLSYRSKKELTGQVRIVEIPGYDVCACCAPHVKLTGEVGIIRLIDAVKYKGGTRVTMVCGFRALKDYHMKEDNVREISRQLSAKPEESAQAVHRLQDEARMWKEKLVRVQIRAMEQILDNLSGDVENYFLFEEDVDKNVARRFVDEGKGKCHGICGIFLGNDTDGYRYILGSESVDLKVFSKGFHETLGGKGGGKPEMIQGTVTSSEEMIRTYMESVLK